VTVVDISGEQLAIDRRVAAERGLQLMTIEAPMDQLSMLDGGRFDLVVQPVSTCYVPTVDGLFAEVARVTRGGGLYVSQHKSPQNLQVSLEPQSGRYVIERPYHTGQPSAGHTASRLREQGTLEFGHTLEALLGGICGAGFVLEGVVEPQHADPDGSIGSFGHRCQYVAPYLRVKARRLGRSGLLP
jgi:SAM-dependent methyltransferase